MFTIENITDNNFFVKFKEFVVNNNEDVLNTVVSYLEIEENYSLSDYSSDEFTSHLIDLYNTDDEKLFTYLSKLIQSNCGFTDLFEEVTSYNYGIKDWLLDNPEEVADDYFVKEPYAYLNDVKVYLFRSRNKICFYHNYSDAECSSYDIFDIKVDLSSQIEEIIKEIEENENP
jgi:hypothetical protein